MYNKIIHQIWIGNDEIPTKFLEYVNRIKKMNHNYFHILWNNDLFEIYKNENLYKLFSGKCKNISNFADLFRLFLLRDYGGIYCDVDMISYKSFDTVWEYLIKYDLTVSANPPELVSEFTNNCFLYSKKQGYHINKICNTDFFKKKYIFDPFDFHCIDFYLKYNFDEKINILPFYYMQSYKYNKETILQHEFAKSWKKLGGIKDL